ncbi:MAG: serine hydrolase [Planctomycetota bacterium]
MTMNMLQNAAAALMLIAGTGFGQPQPAAQPPSPPSPKSEPAPAKAVGPAETFRAQGYDWSKLDAALDKLIDKAKLPGAAMVVYKDNTLIYQRYLGNYTPDTAVMIASSSKWLSGAVIMSLVDEGKLDLDAPISKYLPYFEGDKAAITVRQAFSHTSGLESDYAPAENWLIPMDSAARKVAEDAELVAKPGAEFRYGGTSMQVVGRVAEVVSGKSWNELFKAKLTDPLKMSHTQFGKRGAAPNPLLSGGVSSTLPDYLRFLRAVAGNGEFEGVRVLSEKAVNEMSADQTKGAKMMRQTASRAADGSRYGIGNWVDRKNDKGESVSNSSPGKFGFRPWIDRSRGTLGILMIEDRDTLARGVVSSAQITGIVNAAIDAKHGKPADAANEKIIGAGSDEGGDAQGDGAAEGDAMSRLDANKDGKISLDEVPTALRGLFKRLDKNFDAVLTPDELEGLKKLRGR